MLRRISDILSARAQGKSSYKEPNFPPFCSFLYHNIHAETKGQKKMMAYLNLGMYIFFLIMLIYMMIIGVIYVITTPWKYGIPVVVSSFLYILVLPLVSFFTHYMVVYNACVSTFSIRYFCFFITYLIGVIVCLVFGIGFPGAGVGFITGVVAMMNGVYWLGALCFIANIGWWVIAGVMFGMMIWMNKFWVEDKSSLSQVKNTIVSYFVKRSVSSYI